MTTTKSAKWPSKQGLQLLSAFADKQWKTALAGTTQARKKPIGFEGVEGRSHMALDRLVTAGFLRRKGRNKEAMYQITAAGTRVRAQIAKIVTA